MQEITEFLGYIIMEDNKGKILIYQNEKGDTNLYKILWILYRCNKNQGHLAQISH